MGAAATRAARTSVMAVSLPSGSGDLPQLQDRLRISAGAAVRVQHALGERTAGLDDVGYWIQVRRLVQSGHLLPPLQADPGDAHHVPREIQGADAARPLRAQRLADRKSTRLNSSHGYISYAVFCLKKKKNLHSTLRQQKQKKKTKKQT